MLPDRFRSAFRPATLATLETRGASLQLRKPFFFRGAHIGHVVESERRTFQPMIVVAGARVTDARCTCEPAMKPSDLCRHIATLVARSIDQTGALPSERFESSIWKAVSFAAFNDGRPLGIEQDDDPREQLLRKYVLTDQEEKLLLRGSASVRLRWEESAWYRWAKARFLSDPRGDGSLLELRDRSFFFAGVMLPPASVEHLVSTGIAARSGFEVTPESLEASLQIELTPERCLRFDPVLIEDDTIHRRADLAQYGRFFLFGQRFASPVAPRTMFAEESTDSQSALFNTRATWGLPVDRQSIIAESDVFAFIERHHQELSAMRPELAPDCVRNAQPVRLDGEVAFQISQHEQNRFSVDIAFEHGITGAEIVRARRDGIRALNRGSVWIDVTDPQFASFDSAVAGDDGSLVVSKLDLLRMRASLRGRVVFSSDPSSDALVQLMGEAHSDGAPLPSALGMDLYPYQRTGYGWLWHLHQNGFGGLLCDDMGLGKTHQAMALIRAVKLANPFASVLVVCPASVVDHWRDKLARYTPDDDVEVTTYGIVRSRLEQYRDREIDLLLLDEMQTIKNADTASHQALRALRKKISVGLTGTPIENHEGELKTLLDFVVPGYLPAETEDRGLLQRLVRPFVLRRTKQQVLPELPPKIVDRRYCQMTPEQRTVYRAVMESRARPLRAQLRTGGVSFVHVFAALNYLKQVCNHPATAGGGFAQDVSSGKWDLFVDLLDECMASGLKVVVFSQYLAMLERIEQYLGSRGIGFASIKGATRDRGAEVARFRDAPDCRVFTASLRAGGLGIDLTSASVVIHYDRWWNQAREDQATDRVHRLGQNQGVQVLKLITRGSVEEKIDEIISRKAGLTDILRPDDPSLVKQFSLEELDELLAE